MYTKYSRGQYSTRVVKNYSTPLESSTRVTRVTRHSPTADQTSNN